MTDFKNLCVDLVDALTAHGQPDDAAVGYVAGLLTRARTALAEPEPEEPTDEELDELAWNWYSKTGSTWHQIAAFRAFARAILARWGSSASAPQPQPIPVIKRRPRPEDCDAEGRCWWGAPAYPDLAPASWRFVSAKDRFRSELYWLPANALPQPS